MAEWVSIHESRADTRRVRLKEPPTEERERGLLTSKKWNQSSTERISALNGWGGGEERREEDPAAGKGTSSPAGGGDALRSIKGVGAVDQQSGCGARWRERVGAWDWKAEGSENPETLRRATF